MAGGRGEAVERIRRPGQSGPVGYPYLVSGYQQFLQGIPCDLFIHILPFDFRLQQEHVVHLFLLYRKDIALAVLVEHIIIGIDLRIEDALPEVADSGCQAFVLRRQCRYPCMETVRLWAFDCDMIDGKQKRHLVVILLQFSYQLSHFALFLLCCEQLLVIGCGKVVAEIIVVHQHRFPVVRSGSGGRHYRKTEALFAFHTGHRLR